MIRKLSPWCKEAKKAMIDHDINVTELSERVGISRPYVSGILNGRLIVPELAAKITKELDINEPYVY